MNNLELDRWIRLTSLTKTSSMLFNFFNVLWSMACLYNLTLPFCFCAGSGFNVSNRKVDSLTR